MSAIQLQRIREMADLSQSELDRRAGLPTGTTHNLESGRVERPSWEYVARIVRALRRSGLKGIEAEQVFPIPDTKVAS